MGFYDNYKTKQEKAAAGTDYSTCTLPNGTYQGRVKGVGYKSGQTKDQREWVKLTLLLTTLTSEHKGTEVELEVFGIEGNERSEMRFWGALAVLGYPSVSPDNLVEVLTDEVIGVKGKVVEFRVKHGEKGVFMDLLKTIVKSEDAEPDSFPF